VSLELGGELLEKEVDNIGVTQVGKAECLESILRSRRKKTIAKSRLSLLPHVELRRHMLNFAVIC
jgi:hypothetical protein